MRHPALLLTLLTLLNGIASAKTIPAPVLRYAFEGRPYFIEPNLTGPGYGGQLRRENTTNTIVSREPGTLGVSSGDCPLSIPS